MDTIRIDEISALYQVLNILLPYSIEERRRILREVEKRLATQPTFSRSFVPPASIH
jgi:hypothetical protein